MHDSAVIRALSSLRISGNYLYLDTSADAQRFTLRPSKIKPNFGKAHSLSVTIPPENIYTSSSGGWKLPIVGVQWCEHSRNRRRTFECLGNCAELHKATCFWRISFSVALLVAKCHSISGLVHANFKKKMKCFKCETVEI